MKIVRTSLRCRKSLVDVSFIIFEAHCDHWEKSFDSVNTRVETQIFRTMIEMTSEKTNETRRTVDRFADETSEIPVRSVAHVAVLGRRDDSCFQAILRFLRDCPFVQLLAEVETLPQLFDSGLLPDPAGSPVPADLTAVDLVIVLQSSSDQFAIGDIHRLIGTMLFGRVLCCYGPWCVSDGRSHDLWPVALRVAAASAIPVIASELEAFRRGLIPISPMAASEELLNYRMEHLAEQRRSPESIQFQRLLPESHRDVLVISPDSTFRSMLQELLNSANFRARATFTIDAAIGQITSQRFAGAILIDLDAFSGADIQHLFESMSSRTLQIVGVTGFPVQPSDQQRFGLVLEKSELCWQFMLL